MSETEPFWARKPDEVLRELGSGPEGLSASEAGARLRRDGENTIAQRRRPKGLRLLLSQFLSPIVLVLLAAAVLSGFLGDAPDAIIILIIVLASGLLAFSQERGAGDAMERLLAIVEVKAAVLRDGERREVPTRDVVAGDVVLLRSGSAIPADAAVLEAKDLYVDESALTGESYPVEKHPGPIHAGTPLAERTSALFMGTHVTTGTGKAVVVRTGSGTEFGTISRRLGETAEETGFEHGLRRFGYLLVQIALVLVFAVFAVNVYLHKPILTSFLFSLAIAVGITPQLLPAVMSVNLAAGASRMARAKVIVKKLSSIENFGSMDVLCSDKTGTLTEGSVRMQRALDVEGRESDEVWRWAYVNSAFESSYSDPIDEAIRSARRFDVAGVRELDEEPFDFARKRLSVLVEEDGRRLMITKGSLRGTLDASDSARLSDGRTVDLADVRDRLERLYREASQQGHRVLGVAIRDDITADHIEKTDERGMTFVGVLELYDPPKADAAPAVAALRDLGVTLKIVTGDNPLVAATVGEQMGLEHPRVATGDDIRRLGETALARRVGGIDIFAEIEPSQKEDIIRALKRAGHIVGYLGDGINDAPGLYVADVGISVNSAVDVAKEAADIVLLEKDLGVLKQGVAEGRTTFANTLKYIYMSLSGNFGNMISMSIASLFLPFLPLLPTQILLGNLLTDAPALTISTDNVDPEMVGKPQRWDVSRLRDFMVVFGPINSACDLLTFGVLLFVLRVGEVGFHSGWWLENVFTASLIVLVIRTRRPFWRSRPSRYLLLTTIAVVLVALALPYVPPLAAVFKFAPVPAEFLGALVVIQLFYIVAAEAAKGFYYRREGT